MNERPDLRKLVEQMTAAAVAMQPAFLKLRDALVEAGRGFDQLLWDVYEEAGLPYGPNHAGRERWITEMGKAIRLREEADQIILEHEMHAELRRVLRREG